VVSPEEQNDIADGLIRSGEITEEQLRRALEVSSSTGKPLEHVLVELGLARKNDVYTALAGKMGIQYVDLATYFVDPTLVNLVPEELARRHTVFPLFKVGDSLAVAMADPSDMVSIDELRLAAGLQIESYLSAGEDILRAIEKYYGNTSLVRLMEKMRVEAGSEEGEQGKRPGPAGTKTPLSKLVDLIVVTAVRDSASDIHIEPDEEVLRIRFRIDGVLYDVPSPPKGLQSAIISRIKVLADLDITETRTPQDGHFRLSVDEEEIDVRVSIVPTVHGENAVLRLHSAKRILIGVEHLGLSKRNLKRIEGMLSRPYGMVLVTGPTGSGKTTTLYSALQRINSSSRNIVTIEDPVECRMELVRQIQVNPRANLTFANGLRAILRQDPDVVMVGEIRDRVTAEIAVQAALTGHLVLSTLHTNDAAGVVVRLTDMGVGPFLVSASVIGVIAQRLVRQICESCKESYRPPAEILKKWGLNGGKDARFHRGIGCNACRGTGYSGRIGIFEVMELDESIGDMILRKESVGAIREAARKKGMRLLSEDGLEKALAGITTIEEATRVTEARVDIGAVGERAVEKKSAAEGEQRYAREPQNTEVNVDSYAQEIAGWVARE